MNLIFLAGDPLTYRRTLLSRKLSVESPAAGMSCRKLVWTPAPTVTGGNGASCACSGVTPQSRTHARRAGLFVCCANCAEYARIELHTAENWLQSAKCIAHRAQMALHSQHQNKLWDALRNEMTSRSRTATTIPTRA